MAMVASRDTVQVCLAGVLVGVFMVLQVTVHKDHWVVLNDAATYLGSSSTDESLVATVIFNNWSCSLMILLYSSVRCINLEQF